MSRLDDYGAPGSGDSRRAAWADLIVDQVRKLSYASPAYLYHFTADAPIEISTAPPEEQKAYIDSLVLRDPVRRFPDIKKLVDRVIDILLDVIDIADMAYPLAQSRYGDDDLDARTIDERKNQIVADYSGGTLGLGGPSGHGDRLRYVTELYALARENDDGYGCLISTGRASSPSNLRRRTFAPIPGGEPGLALDYDWTEGPRKLQSLEGDLIFDGAPLPAPGEGVGEPIFPPGDSEAKENWISTTQAYNRQRNAAFGAYPTGFPCPFEPPPRGLGVVEAPPPCPEEDDLEGMQMGDDVCPPDISSGIGIIDWTTQEDPYFDAQGCQYMVPVTTMYSCPPYGSESILRLSEEYISTAVALLMDFVRKDPSGSDVEGVLAQYIAEYPAVEFYKPPIDNIKLLYKIPFGLIRAMRLPDASAPGITPPEGTQSEVTLETEDLLSKIDDLGQILNILAADQGNLLTTDQTKIVVAGTGREVDLAAESVDVETLKTSIVNVLRENSFILASEGSISRSEIAFPLEKKVANQIIVRYDSSFNLVKMFARETGTEAVEISLQTLRGNEGLNSPTLLSYLSQINSILALNDTSQGILLRNFVLSYHYPSVDFLLPRVDSPSTGTPGIFSDLEQSFAQETILSTLTSAADQFNEKFQRYQCMDPSQLEDRDILLKQSAEQLRDILDDEKGQLVDAVDGLFSSAINSYNSLVADAKGIQAGWDKLFNKMSACGLGKMLLETFDFISGLTCGLLDPEELIKKAISSILGQIDAPDLRQVFENIPPGVQAAILTIYYADISAAVSLAGYSRGNQLPWDYAESRQLSERQREEGTSFYAVDDFIVPSPEERTEAQTTALEQGFFGGGVATSTPAYAEDAFWTGFIARTRGVESLADVVYEEFPALQSIGSAPNTPTLAVNLGAQMVNTFIENLINNLTFEQLLEAVQQIPAVSIVLDKIPIDTECIVNTNDSQNRPQRGLNSNQNNLSQGGQKEICDLFGGFTPITKPDISQLLGTTLNIDTTWAAFQNALIEAITTLIATLLVNSLVVLLKIVGSLLEGRLCDLVRQAADQIADELRNPDIPTTNLEQLFSEAMVGAGVPLEEASQRFARLFSNFGGLTLEDVLPVLSGDNNLIDALAARLRADQLISLLEGTASDRVIDIALATIRSSYPRLSDVLTDRGSVRLFFHAMGNAFPPGFLQSTRETIGLFGGDADIIVSLCGLDTSDSLDNLAQRLRDECGDSITEEQIQTQLDHFENVVTRAIDELIAPIAAGGFDAATADTFRTALDAAIPRDEPGNLSIAEEIIAGMFDPMYIFYTNDLMKPIQPNRSAGILNMILANRNSVPQRGQLANYNAANGFAGIFAGPDAPPVSDLEKRFFGPEESGEVRLKPTTVADRLRLGLVGLRFVEDEDTQVVFNFDSADYTTEEKFTLSYNFDSGEMDLVYAVPDLPDRPGISFVHDANSIYRQLAEQGTIIDQIEESAYEDAEEAEFVGTTRVGAKWLMYLQRNTGLLNPASSYPQVYEDNKTIVRAMKEDVGRYITNAIRLNQRAFKYGEYNLQELTSESLAAGSAPGYEIYQLTTGQYLAVPDPKDGWLEYKDNLIPRQVDQYCCPDKKELFDIPGVVRKSIEAYRDEEDDPRLSLNPRTVNQPPYNKILTRMNASAIEGTVICTVRTYIIEHFLKGMSSFTKFKTNMGLTFNDVTAAYVAAKIEQGLRRQGPFPGAPAYPAAAPPSPLPAPSVPPEEPTEDGNLLYAYWYQFLEQACQVVSRRVRRGQLQPSTELDAAMRRLQTLVEEYRMPQRSDLLTARSVIPDPIQQLSITLKRLRQKDRIVAIRDSRDDAMTILKYLILDEYERLNEDTEEIFREPDFGWINNIYEDFYRFGTYGSTEYKIFDVPPANTTRLGGALGLERGVLVPESFNRSRFILEAYVRGTRTASGASRLSRWNDDYIYGTYEALQILADAGLTPNSPLGNIFDAFKYGLRLVYVPSPEVMSTVSDSGGLQTRMNGTFPVSAGRDIANRLYPHTALDATSEAGAYSIPVVYSEDLEEELIGLELTFSQFENEVNSGIEAAGAWDIGSDGLFNWNLLGQRMRASEAYRLMFGHAIPMPTMLSLTTIYTAEALLATIGKDDNWSVFRAPDGLRWIPVGSPPPLPPLLPPRPPPNSYYRWNRKFFPQLRRKLKRLFLELYNSNDFTYRPESRLQPGIDNATDTSRSTTPENPTGQLGPSLANNVIIQEGGLCGEPIEGAVFEEPVDETPTTPDVPPVGESEFVCARWVHTYRTVGGSESETIYQILPRERDGSGQTLEDLLAGDYYARAPRTINPRDPGGPAGDIVFVDAPDAVSPSAPSDDPICEDYGLD